MPGLPFCNAKRQTCVFFQLFAWKKADFFSALAFYHENRQKKRLVDLFTRAKGQAVFFSGFLQRKHPVTKKKTVVLCSKRKVRVVFVSIIAISPDELRLVVPFRLVVPLGCFLQVLFHPKTFPIALGKLQCGMIPTQNLLV